MTRTPWFRKILYSSFFLALIPASILVVFIPSFGNKYTLKLRQELLTANLSYMDLNSDGVSERIEITDVGQYQFVSVKDQNLRFYDDWPFADSLDSSVSGPYFGDYDSDGYSELYVFSYKCDSLFLSLYEILQPGSKKTDRIYVDRCGYLNGRIFSHIFPIGFYDRNNDGLKEFYFSQSSSGTTGPRKIYSFDIESREFDSSIPAGSTLMNAEMADMDGDQKPEIFGFTSASGNYPADAPYSDSSAWFMVFNEDLEFNLPPVEFPGFANGMRVFPYFGNYLLVFNNYGNDPRSSQSRLMISTPDGKINKEKLIRDLGINSSLFSTLVFRESGTIIIAGDKIVAVDSSFKTSEYRTSDMRFEYSALIDMNHDGTEEIILYSLASGKLMILKENLDLLFEKDFFLENIDFRISHLYKAEGNPELFVQNDNMGYYISMKPNKLYYLGCLSYPCIYLLSLLFIVFVRKINTLQVVQREELKKRLLTLQLKGIKAQLDPHFTFNTFNSVASLIYLNDKQSAYDYMNKFSHLLRKMFNDAERIYRKLGEEIEFVSIYLELEKLRFGDKFNYTIETGEGVNNNELVPKLVLHTFAENAVKHGLMPSDRPGILKIRIDKAKAHLKILVEDNGIGRVNSKGTTRSTGMGLKLTNEFYEILNRMNDQPMSYTIKDLYDEKGNPRGTSVEILVPLQIVIPTS